MLSLIQWRSLLRRRRFESEMESEFTFHYEARTRDLVRVGLTEEEARRQARLEFGASQRYQEECRTSHGLHWLDEITRNVRYSMRILRKSPGFSAAALISLSLGIGVNALVFSVLNALLLQPLPVRDPQRIVFLESSQGPSYSFPDYLEFRNNNASFDGVVGTRMAPMVVNQGGTAIRTWGYLATGNYFDVLGIQPAVGRFFHQSEDLRPCASPYAVLSYGSWQSRFGGDPAIAGRTVRINGLNYTVLGVAPRGFHGTELFYWPEVWVPMMMQSQIEPGNDWLKNRNTWDTWIFGRLKPGVASGAAEADLSRITAGLIQRFPDSDKGLSVRLARPGLAGNTLRGPVKAFAFGVLALASLVLLTACSNLAALMLARATDHQRDMAIRLAIGAGRGRLMGQVLTDSLLLATGGGIAAWALAFVLAKFLSEWRAPLEFPVQFDVSPDWHVLVFTAGVSLLAAVVFGFVPAWKLSRADVNGVLKGGPGVLLFKKRLSFGVRDLLLVTQVSLCFVLVFASLLAVEGLRKALQQQIGMQIENVTTAAFDLGLSGYSPESGKTFQLRALRAVQALPGIISAAYANSLPLSIDQSTTSVSESNGVAAKGRDAVQATYYDISPGLVHTLGIRLLQGREFDWTDGKRAQPLAIVNETFAKRVMHTDKPVGHTFRWGFGSSSVEVIGLVQDGKYQSLTEAPRPAVFFPVVQSYNPTTTLVIRSSLPAPEVSRQLRECLNTLDPDLPLYDSGSLARMLGFALFPMRTASIALGTFGLLAIVLAITGIHALAAYVVAQRTRELGIRIALGARTADVLQTIAGKLGLILAGGLLAGAVLAIACGPLLSAVVYGISPRDPHILSSVLALLAVAVGASCWRPLARALHSNPAKILRCD